MARKKPGNTPPPASTDVEGWRAAIKARQLPYFRLEDMIAAIQDLKDVDEQVKSKVAREVNDRFFRILRKAVGRNHPNSGEDIIHRTIYKLFEAIGKPNSNDGRALRKSCYSLIKLRMIDAIREKTANAARQKISSRPAKRPMTKRRRRT